MQKIKAFVFDIGDTIYPSSQTRIDALKEIIAKYKLPDSFVEKYLEVEGKLHKNEVNNERTLQETIQGAFDLLNIETDAAKIAWEVRKAHWRRTRKFFTETELGKEFQKVVNFLREQGYKTAILSDNTIINKNWYIEFWEELRLEFDAFVVSEEMQANKPSEKMFGTIIELLNIKPEEAVYFGNNLERDAAAINYGWRFVWVYGFMDVSASDFSGDKMEFITLENIKAYLMRKLE
jgi:FMN phosphatase YigB (HAD superfamily)